MTHRVVVTGMGTVNPIGLDVASTWQSVINGISGVGPITRFDSSDLKVHIACEINGFDAMQHLSAKEARRMDLYEQYAMAAVQEAMQQSGLEIGEQNAGRVGVIISSAVGGFITLHSAFRVLFESGARRLNPFIIPMFMPNGAAGMVAIKLGARGPCFSIASACASGGDSIGQAWLLLRAGIVDAAIAGGSEATITEMGIGAFDRMGALSRRNDKPYRTPSPFDTNRDGLVMGEGSGILILETLDHAKARGTEVLAELIGYGSTVDAHHITAPAEEGQGGAAAMKNAMSIAKIDPHDVDYVNAHGTGTRLNDVAETRAIKTALGEHAYSALISSTKSMTGHLMGATASLEALFCVQAIREMVVPPTINLREPDPECDLDYVPNQPREWPVRVAMTNAFGFGGHNAVLAFREFSG
jgi:3-oxoacyl-[acyl-carrier-protein] synthase II